MKPRNHGRAADKTAIGVSMSKRLKAKIQAAAAKENRTVSNYITHHLEQFLEKQRPDTSSEQLIAAAKAQQSDDPEAREQVLKDIAARQLKDDADKLRRDKA